MAEAIYESFWNATGALTAYDALEGGAEADVAVIGGGIVGMTVADHLKREGLRVAVVESLRCVVAWNAADEVWECPCHGSVFDRDGHVIHGPAVRDLRRHD